MKISKLNRLEQYKVTIGLLCELMGTDGLVDTLSDVFSDKADELVGTPSEQVWRKDAEKLREITKRAPTI